MQIELNGIVFQIIHKTNKKIKRVGILLENKDEIIVKTPLKFKVHTLREIILRHQDWILRMIESVPAKNKFDFICGGKIPLLGVYYPMQIIQKENIVHIQVKFDGEQFFFYHGNGLYEYEDFLDALKKFYKRIVEKYIDPIFDEYCFKTKLHPNKISYRYASKQWGSCSYKNDISINYMLLEFPIKAIEYVVLHELCHIEEKNHSQRFYNLIALYMSDYKQQEELLKKKIF